MIFEGFSLELEDTFNAKGLIVDKEVVSFDDSTTINELVDVMGLGWNLDNTLEVKVIMGLIRKMMGKS